MMNDELVGSQKTSGSKPGSKSEKQRTRFSFTKEQLAVMEKVYKVQKFPDATTIGAMSDELDVVPVRVKLWFRNRRAKDRQKKDKTVIKKKYITEEGKDEQIQRLASTDLEMSYEQSVVKDVNEKYYPTYQFPFSLPEYTTRPEESNNNTFMPHSNVYMKNLNPTNLECVRPMPPKMPQGFDDFTQISGIKFYPYRDPNQAHFQNYFPLAMPKDCQATPQTLLPMTSWPTLPVQSGTVTFDNPYATINELNTRRELFKDFVDNFSNFLTNME